MAVATLYKRYLWLVDLIYNAKTITREDIDRAWARSSINDEHSTRIPERTFHHWKDAILDMFDIVIECDKRNGNVYHIVNRNELEHSTTYRWLLNTLSVAQLVSDNKELKDKIILEDMPSDTLYLSPLMEAIRTGRVAQISYQPFGTPAPYIVNVEPYCLKVFRRRWYVIGRPSIAPDTLKPYCLDRIKQLTLLDDTYTIPEDFDAQEYFRNYYGICRNEYTSQPQRLVLEVLKEEADYFRSLPLHHSQKEIEEKDGFVYFEYYLVPTFDLFQELQLHGSAIRVVEPDIFKYWLKKEAELIFQDYEDFDDVKYEIDHPRETNSAQK